MAVPTIDEYVQAFLTQMRAPLRESTVSTVAGTVRLRKSGERVLLGPRGEKIRVIEHPEGGNQIEHGERQHAVIRPHIVRSGAGVHR